jgi:bifunctional pyridoxal-dependent enzyme with beta-cystathionase and maltose regulon repressor activities
MHTYTFSEYDFTLPSAMRTEIHNLLAKQIQYPVDLDEVDKAIDDCVENYYQFARSENKNDRDASPVSSMDFVNSITELLAS